MKRMLASLLCIVLALATVLTFTGCSDDQDTVPDGVGAPGGETAGETKQYTKEEAKVALAGMTEQFAGEKRFALDMTLSLTVPYSGIAVDIAVPLKIEADAETNVYHFRTVIPGILFGERENTTAELYVSPAGTYVGTDRDVTDEYGNSVMGYRFFPEITTDFISGILADIPADDGTGDAGDATRPGNFPGLSGSGIVSPDTSLRLSAAPDGGYYLTASVDMARLAQALLSVVIRILDYSPRSLASKYLDADLLRKICDRPVKELVAALDEAVGKETADVILTLAASFLRGDTGEDDDFNVRVFLEEAPDDMTLTEVCLAIGGATSDDGQHPTIDTILSDLLLQLPEESVGSLVTIPGTEETLTDYLRGVFVISCEASVTFTLTDTYLPTAAVANAKVGWSKGRTIYRISADVSATAVYDRPVTLPENPLLLPTETQAMLVSHLPDGHMKAVLTYDLNGFSVDGATVRINGTTVTVTPEVDEATGEIILSDIEREDGVPATEFVVTLVFTRTVEDHTYTFSDTVGLPLGDAGFGDAG